MATAALSPALPTVSVQVLGHFAVRRSGLHIDLRHGGERLLAFLGLQQHPVPRSSVAGALWPDSPQAQASANLRATLSRLPNPGERPLTSTQNAQLSLSEHVQVDMWVADDQIREARAFTPAPTARETPLDDVLALLHHDVLPLWTDEWVLVERERHRQSRLHSLELLSQTLCGAGDYEGALRAGLAAVAGEPLRESAHLRVIEAHLAEHNPGEALRQYDMYRRLLSAELGLQPSAELRMLLRPLQGLKSVARVV